MLTATSRRRGRIPLQEALLLCIAITRANATMCHVPCTKLVFPLCYSCSVLRQSWATEQPGALIASDSPPRHALRAFVLCTRTPLNRQTDLCAEVRTGRLLRLLNCPAASRKELAPSVDFPCNHHPRFPRKPSSRTGSQPTC